MFEGFAGQVVIDDGGAAFAFRIIDVGEALERHFLAVCRVDPADSGVEHQFFHEQTGGPVVAVTDLEKLLLLAVHDLAAAWIAAGVHGVDGQHFKDAVGRNRFFSDPFVVWAADENGA